MNVIISVTEPNDTCYPGKVAAGKAGSCVENLAPDAAHSDMNIQEITARK